METAFKNLDRSERENANVNVKFWLKLTIRQKVGKSINMGLFGVFLFFEKVEKTIIYYSLALFFMRP